MPDPTSSHVLRELIARMDEPIHLRDMADKEATRIMIELHLHHPMTLPAAIKVVATELQHGRLSEIEETAKALHGKLLHRHAAPRIPQ